MKDNLDLGTQTTSVETPDVRIVAIGASAGGLEALSQLVGPLTRGQNYCFVVVQHLAPHYPSLLGELLSRETSLEVREMANEESSKADCISVVPPNSDVEYREGKFFLSPPESRIGPKPSVNRFLKSLTRTIPGRTVAVILSGTGSDGAEGVSALKNAGGQIFVQEPSSARYRGMPDSAIETGKVDHVLSAEGIGLILAGRTRLETKHLGRHNPTEEFYRKILGMLHSDSGIDFCSTNPLRSSDASKEEWLPFNAMTSRPIMNTFSKIRMKSACSIKTFSTSMTTMSSS